MALQGPDRLRDARGLPLERLVDRRVEVVDPLVHVAGPDAEVDPVGVDVRGERVASFIVAARGWAPPIPPSPAVTTRRLRRVPPK